MDDVKRKIIFLDIGGVLVRERYPSGSACNVERMAAAECVAALNVLVETAKAHVVLMETACWGGLHHVTNMLREWGVRGNIVGSLPEIGGARGARWVTVSRARRITEWLKLYGMNVEAYVVIDDSDDMPPAMAGHHVRPTASRGLTAEDVRSAMNIFVNAIVLDKLSEDRAKKSTNLEEVRHGE